MATITFGTAVFDCNSCCVVGAMYIHQSLINNDRIEIGSIFLIVSKYSSKVKRSS